MTDTEYMQQDEQNRLDEHEHEEAS